MLARSVVSSTLLRSRSVCTASSNIKSAPVHAIINKNETKSTEWDNAIPFSKIPGPKSIPFVGTWPWMAFGKLANREWLEFSKNLFNEYGPIVKMEKFLSGYDCVLLYDSTYIEHLFRNEGQWPIREAVNVMVHHRKLRPQWFKGHAGLAGEHGPKWQQFRSIVNPILMQPSTVAQYISIMEDVAEEFIERMRYFAQKDPKNQMPENFENEIHKFAMETVCLIAIDKRMGCLKPNIDPKIQKLIDSVMTVFELTFKLDFQLSFWRYFQTPTYRRFIKNFDYVTSTIVKNIDKAEEQFKNSPEKPESEQSAMERLLKIDKQVAFTMAIDMIVAGIDTSSKTIGSTLYFLAKNPEVQEKLREELIRLLPTKDTPITKSVLDNAQYLKAVVRETQRLAPIGINNIRTLSKDMVIGGYQIPKNTNVLTVHLVLCLKDFPHAEKFIPERYLRTTKGELSHKNVNPFTSLPFGFGPRSCIGKRLAILEMEICIAKVIRNFRLDWHEKDMAFGTKLLYGIKDPLKLTVLDVK